MLSEFHGLRASSFHSLLQCRVLLLGLIVSGLSPLGLAFESVRIVLLLRLNPRQSEHSCLNALAIVLVCLGFLQLVELSYRPFVILMF